MNPKTNGHTLIYRLLSDRLLWLEAKRENGELQIASAGEVPLVREEDTSLQEAAASALKELKTKMEIHWYSGCDIVLTAPGNLYTARYTQMPAVDEESLRDAVSFEVAETLQISPGDFLWDQHQSTHPSEDGTIHLIWAAARKSTVASLLSAIPKHTLYPDQITPDFWAVYETLLSRNPDLIAEASIITYMDGSHLMFVVADQRAIYFTRSVGLRNHEESHPFTQLWRTEIQRLLTYVPERFEIGIIQNIIFCGLDGLSRDALRQLAEQHGLHCVQITLPDMEPIVSVPSGCHLRAEHFPLLCVLDALFQQGLSGINLMDESEKGNWWESLTAEESLPPRPIMKKIGMMAGAVIVLWVTQIIWFQYAAASYLEEGKELLRVANHLKNEETALRSLSRTHIAYDDLFLFLAEILPENVLIKNITLDTQSGVDLVLTGGNNQIFQAFVEELNSSQFFKEIIVSRSANESTGFTVYLKGKLRV